MCVNEEGRFANSCHFCKSKNPCVYPVRNNARCSAEGLDFRIIPAGFNAPLEFLTGFTIVLDSRWSLPRT